MRQDIQTILDKIERGDLDLDQAAAAFEAIGVDPADIAGEAELARWYFEQGV